MKKNFVLMHIICLGILVSLAACSPAPTPLASAVTPVGGDSNPGDAAATLLNGVGSGSTVSAGTAVVVGTVEVGTAEVSTAMPSTGELVTPTPAGPMAVTPGVPLSVTLADRGRTVNLKVGESFLLNLGEGFTWSPVVADLNIVSRVPNIMVIRGAQGVYKANAPGTTTLNATGDPACRQSKPACMTPSLLFTINLVVTQ